MSEPIRHHYIPKFLLRNFSHDAGKRFVYYYDRKKKSLEEKQIRDVFMAKNLYRDEQNFPDLPTKTEGALAKYESEVAPILQEKILAADEIRLTVEEEAKLKLFFAVMGFRSKETSLLFGKNMTDAAKEMYRRYQKDGDYTDLWKRNLSHIVTCRSNDEVQRHTEIDDPFKLFFRRDTEYICGMHFAVAESAESELFIIGDTYPVDISVSSDGKYWLHLYSVFPLSPRRVLLLVANGAERAPQSVTNLRECALLPPYPNSETGTLRMRVKKLCPEEIRHLNGEILHNAHDGVIFSRRPSCLPDGMPC